MHPRAPLGQGVIVTAIGLGDQLRAVLDGIGGGAKLRLRLAVQFLGPQLVAQGQRLLALSLQRPMIDALNLARQFKGMVLQLGPKAAHSLELRPARAGGIKDAGLVGQPLGGQNSGGRQNVCVMVALIALAVRGHGLPHLRPRHSAQPELGRKRGQSRPAPRPTSRTARPGVSTRCISTHRNVLSL